MTNTETPLTIQFHGAAGTVTGSCMELTLGQHRILIDCGLFQGSRSLEALNHGAFAFEVGKIDAVLLTHAHIDHCGLLPKLAKEGYHGSVWCTAPTADLLEYMLADAGRIQESDTARRNRRYDRAGEAMFEPLYTEADGLRAWRLAEPVGLGTWFEPAPGFRARLWNAGHILGSASVELEAGGVHLLFSGDIGPDNKAFHDDPAAPEGIDFLICEATYGDRTRPKLSIEQRRALLETEVKAALARDGNLVIPTFALERTQELLLDLARLADANRIPNVPIFELCQLLVAAGGTIANVGVHGAKADLHLEHLWSRNITITTRLVDTVSTPQLLRMVEAKQLDPGELVTHHFAMTDMMDAYEVFSRAAETKALKVIIEADDPRTTRPAA